MTDTHTNGNSHANSTNGTSAADDVGKAAMDFSMFPKPPKFDDKKEEREYLKGRLAAAFRIFAKFGFDEGVAGHITCRDPIEPDTFWVNPFGVSFGLMKRSDLVRINHEGKVIDGGPCRLINRAAVMIHAAVHHARPDVLCAAHSHSIYGRTFASLGMPLSISTQDACAFYEDLALYNQFGGVVLDEEEGGHIAKAIGSKKAVILQNHGLLTTGETIESTVFWFVSLEKLCHSQLLAMAACAYPGASIKEIGEEEAKYTHKTVGSSYAGWFSAKPLFDNIAKETGEDYLE
ncbi:hypothetical protein VHEMI10244 [[Torrubiella] hemipterigena]|uniref:Class II aldolase/adducin N-terminal domain-containing protein n=1 Tax=[Torrubiella] hemipterigena TaxID=1531966 RepID=A0A0A1TRV3_9HYPO|nr:hypothetical protein VHEMI10244 [[Torrubiella] hemipterigena]